MGVFSLAAMGIASMVGAGIFALLGEAGLLAGAASYISFFIGGVVALLSGYSLSKLGARFPSAGGLVEYLTQIYVVNLFSGGLPAAYGKALGQSREGLLISLLLIIILTLFLDLSQIAAVGSLAILTLHLFVHTGHFKVIHKKRGHRHGLLSWPL